MIGIAALNNCAVQIVPRDLAIGWSAAGLALALTTLFSPADPRRAREASEPAVMNDRKPSSSPSSLA